jgi:hypothetical protein
VFTLTFAFVLGFEIGMDKAARHGMARHGVARHGVARHGTAGTARCGRHGTAGQATTGHSTARQRHGTAGHGMARHGTVLVSTPPDTQCSASNQELTQKTNAKNKPYPSIIFWAKLPINPC